MPESERQEGFVGHWRRGEFLLDEFEALTRELARLDSQKLPFAPISRDSVLQRFEAPMPGHGNIEYWGARGDYKSATVRHDLTHQFNSLP